MRRLGVVSVARSDYGIYRPLLHALTQRDDVELLLYVGGMHLLEQFGYTIEEIERDGFPIAARVDFAAGDDTPLGVAASIGRGVQGFAEAFVRSRPDLLVVLGDRAEMFAAGIAALPLTIPLAHIHGGETTEGAIDETIRHALTKLSHLHFAATDEYARRIVQLGEDPWRVVVSGAPALDTLVDFTPLPDAELERRGVHLRRPTLLVTYHPVTLASERAHGEIQALLDAVADSGLDAVLTYPNADAGHGRIIEAIEQFASASDRYTVIRSLGSEGYFTLMGRAIAMVGNSSSGIIEAASFELPVVDVGDRQAGRLRGPNVIHVACDQGKIAAAIARAASVEFRRSLAGLANPYGDGHASPRIVERLLSVPLDERLLSKRLNDAGGS